MELGASEEGVGWLSDLRLEFQCRPVSTFEPDLASALAKQAERHDATRHFMQTPAFPSAGNDAVGESEPFRNGTHNCRFRHHQRLCALRLSRWSTVPCDEKVTCRPSRTAPFELRFGRCAAAGGLCWHEKFRDAPAL